MKNTVLRIFLDREIANFYLYLNILDEELSLKSEEVSTSIDGTYKELNEISLNEERNKELISLMVEADRVKEFTNLMRQSFLTSLYSFMELWLVRACYIDSKLRDGGVSYESINKKKKGIKKAKEYFSRIMKSNYPFDSSQDRDWITNFQLLRDCIIHRQGSLTGHSDFEIDPILAKFVTTENGLSLFEVENRQIFVEYEFCVKALKIVHKFMVELLSL